MYTVHSLLLSNWLFIIYYDFLTEFISYCLCAVSLPRRIVGKTFAQVLCYRFRLACKYRQALAWFLPLLAWLFPLQTPVGMHCFRRAI